MTPSDPVFQFRARENADPYSVEVGVAWSVNPPYRGAAFDRPELDANRVEHRPQERAVLAREARGLTDRGLTPRDVADALGLSERAVVELLVEVCRARK